MIYIFVKCKNKNFSKNNYISNKNTLKDNILFHLKLNLKKLPFVHVQNNNRY